MIKKLPGGGKHKTTIQQLNGSIDNKDMANILNDYFTDIGPNLSADMPYSLSEIDYTFDNSREQFKLEQTNTDEVRILISRMSNNKSTSVNGVPIRFLKMGLDITSETICFIIDLSLSTMRVPKGWKTCV